MNAQISQIYYRDIRKKIYGRGVKQFILMNIMDQINLSSIYNLKVVSEITSEGKAGDSQGGIYCKHTAFFLPSKNKSSVAQKA